MIRRLLLGAAVLLSAGVAHAEGPPAGTGYTDYSGAFVAFYDATEGLDLDARVAAFKRDVARLYPGFYAPRGGLTAEQADANIRRAIEEFPAIREKYLAARRVFPEELAKATRHFRRYFPDSNAALPTYLVHSLGEMDGGTREIDGQPVMVFGADGIARYHTLEDLGAFFDHEFLHVEQGAVLHDCGQVWCSLWEEGLATAAAAAMNPGVSDEALMLTIPKPIRPVVDAHWREALCEVAARQDSTDGADYKALFFGNGGTDLLPPRAGYYVGYRLAERLLGRHALVELAHMPREQAEPLVKGELAAMAREAGGCHGPDAPAP